MNAVTAWLGDIFRGRPWWLNALMLFSAYMTFVYVPWDLVAKPLAEDREVWFGIAFSGWVAKLLAIPHWLVYAAGTYGLRRMRPWMRLWGSVYVGQVAFSMFVWNLAEWGGLMGVALGVFSALPFVVLALALWNAHGHFHGERASLSERYGPGGWAVVTGASSGLGAEFARALAREGLPVLLCARREARLAELASEIERSAGVATRVVVADLAQPEGIDQLSAAVSELDLAVIVHNAGFGHAGRFERCDEARLHDQVMLHCLAPTLLTHRLLPRLRQRGRGAIVILGSVAGHQPLPLHAVYAATKAYDLFLGEALWEELRDSGIEVLVVEPGSTATEFQEVAGEIAHGGRPPAEVVDEALLALGDQPSLIPGWFEWIRAQLATRLAPRDLVLALARDVTAQRVPEERR